MRVASGGFRQVIFAPRTSGAGRSLTLLVTVLPDNIEPGFEVGGINYIVPVHLAGTEFRVFGPKFFLDI
jgi:hypothetical protein